MPDDLFNEREEDRDDDGGLGDFPETDPREGRQRVRAGADQMGRTDRKMGTENRGAIVSVAKDRPCQGERTTRTVTDEDGRT